jgi:hypothetical protein
MKELHHYSSIYQYAVTGTHRDIINTQNIRGNCTGIRGSAHNITGDVSGLHGDVTGLSGDCANIALYFPDDLYVGDISSLRGGDRIMGASYFVIPIVEIN